VAKDLPPPDDVLRIRSDYQPINFAEAFLVRAELQRVDAGL
jgi:hypothetical protein